MRREGDVGPPIARRSFLEAAMNSLRLYDTYDRRDVHDLFEPETTFTPSAGTWGMAGIIPIRDRAGDFVLFVTYGRSQGAHEFDEGISADGILRWQSQPRQGIRDPQIERLINTTRR